MKVIELPKWIMFGGYGLTLWKLVFIRKGDYDKTYVIEHERVHVEQWMSIGFFKFPYLYLKELYNVGYEKNIYEVEARRLGEERAIKIKNT